MKRFFIALAPRAGDASLGTSALALLSPLLLLLGVLPVISADA